MTGNLLLGREGALSEHPTGFYVMLVIFVILALRWILHVRTASNSELAAFGVLHEAIAAATLALVYIDRRWIWNSSLDHPYDSLFPFPSDPTNIRMWQQFLFAVLCTSTCSTLMCKLDGTLKARMVPLSGAALSLFFLMMSDLLMAHFAHLVSLAIFVALCCKSVDASYPVDFALRLTFGPMYLFSGLNKVNPNWLETGFSYITEEFMPGVASNNNLVYVASLAIALGEAVAGFGLMVPFALCQKLAAGSLVLMHMGIITMLVVKHWGYSVMPINAAFLSANLCFLLKLSAKDGGGNYESGKSNFELSDVHYEKGWVDSKVGSWCWRAFSKALLPLLWFVFFLAGPFSYSFSRSPTWPNNSGFAFSMYSMNENNYMLQGPLNSSSLISEYTTSHIMSDRMSLGSQTIAEGFCYLQSWRSQFAFASWLARASNQPIHVRSSRKLPLGLRRVADRGPNHAESFLCNPTCYVETDDGLMTQIHTSERSRKGIARRVDSSFLGLQKENSP